MNRLHPRCRPVSRGFSLIELLIVLALMGVAAAMLIPDSSASTASSLTSAAQRVAADIAYTRGLAVTHASTYRLTFAPATHSLTLTHVGVNPALNQLPPGPLSPRPAIAQTTSLQQLPGLSDAVRLAQVVVQEGQTLRPTDRLQIGPYGESTEPAPTIVTLAAGAASLQRFIAIRVDPITSHTHIGPVAVNAAAAIAAVP